jgi:protein-tyrosine-phosphatase
MAEAILRHKTEDRFEIHSAGILPRVVHPLTVHALQRRGVPTRSLTSKSIRDYFGTTEFDHVIILSDGDQLPFAPFEKLALRSQFWAIADPSVVKGDYTTSVEAYSKIVDQIDAAVSQWIESLACVKHG